MEEQFPLLYNIALNIGLPIVTLFAGWFGQAWKSKAQKKADDLDNMQQIISMQREYITEQQGQMDRYNENLRRVEEKLDEKREAIRQANKCTHVKKGGKCPVLTRDENLGCGKCETCKYNEGEGDADCEN